ncbi:MAG: AMP-binding protein [Spirochaetales bacterium]|nr:AMP-binding protein [Spirochaetales bacterium]
METIEDLKQYTFPALLANSVKKFYDRPALALVGEYPMSYGQVKEKSEALSYVLEQLGLKRNSKVVILGTGRPEWGIAYFAIVNRGMIAVPLLPDFSVAEVESILAHCGVDAMFIEEKLYKKIECLGNNLPPVIIKLEDYSLIRGDEEAFEKADHFVRHHASEIKASLAPVEISEDDTASIIYTSGTTGRSKGVELSHKNIVWTSVQCQSVHRVNKIDRALSFLPLSHVYEFTIGFVMMLLNGACVYYLGKPPVVSALLPAFEKVEPTIVLSVPLVMEKIYKNKVLPTFQSNKILYVLYRISPFRKMLNRAAGKKLKKTFGGHLVFFGIGGAKVDPKVEKFLKEAKFPYAIGYGLTETSPLLAGSGTKITFPGTVGPAMEGVELVINNPDPKTKIGEVVAKGPNIMKGYYRDPELTKTVFTTEEDSAGPGYFKTGDLGLISKKKGLVRLSLKGRNKNMILGPSGENIYPEDIEFILNQNPFVNESLVVEGDGGLVAIVKVDEEKLEEEAKQISLRDKIENNVQKVSRDLAWYKEAILGEIQYFVNTRVNKSSHIGKIEKIDEFEKTATQKIKRYIYELKEKAKSKIK